MRNEFTALVEPDGEWFAAYCLEVPEANGQGRTADEAKQDLVSAILLVLADRRADLPGYIGKRAVREVITVNV